MDIGILCHARFVIAWNLELYEYARHVTEITIVPKEFTIFCKTRRKQGKTAVLAGRV
jgi:hypothetical protein